MSLISTAGLFWHLEDVFWGHPGQAGSLLGVPCDATSSKPVDFRDQIGIYILYADYDLVYVGQTGTGEQRLFDRLKQHTADDLGERWNRFSWLGIRRVGKDGVLSAIDKASHPSLADVLNHMEAVVIYTAEPPLNRQGGRFGDSVIWYEQRRDERLEPSQEEMLREIWRRLKNSDD